MRTELCPHRISSRLPFVRKVTPERNTTKQHSSGVTEAAGRLGPNDGNRGTAGWVFVMTSVHLWNARSEFEPTGQSVSSCNRPVTRPVTHCWAFELAASSSNASERILEGSS